MMVIENIIYSHTAGNDGIGDFYLPEKITVRTPLVLLIHGGGWSSLDKDRMVDIAGFFCQELGFAVYNINYRRTCDARWPACGDDCLAAANFLLDGDIPELNGICREKILIAGGSSGGHLALMTGLRLAPEKVSGIISLSGISSLTEDFAMTPRRYRSLFGHDPLPEELQKCDPVNFIAPDSPPVLCTHDYDDNVVPITAAQHFSAAARELGVKCSNYFYRQNEEGYSHRLFIPGTVKLYDDIEKAIANWLANNFEL